MLMVRSLLLILSLLAGLEGQAKTVKKPAKIPNRSPIFQIISPAGSSREMTDTNVSDYDSPTRAALKAVCRAGGACLEFTGTMRGTGFIFEQPDQLRTSLHTFQKFLLAHWQNNSGQKILLPLVLQQDGEVIFGGNKDLAYVTIPEQTKQVLLNGTLKNHPELDRVTIYLSKALARPLPKGLSTGSTVSLEGIVDLGLLQMNGSTVEKESIGKTEFSPEALAAITTADYNNAPNLSGSPVFNAQREVIGIHTGELKFGSGSLSYFISPD